MKTNIRLFSLAVAGMLLCTSCIGDLDTLPLNESDSTSETVYGTEEYGYLAGLTKIYFQFVSNETTDLQVSDGGASELIRAFWSTQECTTDEAKCAWENDAWVRDLNENTWSEASNDATYAVYVRTLQGIAYVNEYLRQTSSDKLAARGVSSELAAKIEQFRNNQIGHGIINRRSEENDSVHHETAEYIHRGHIELPLLNNGRIDICIVCRTVAVYSHRTDAQFGTRESVKILSGKFVHIPATVILFQFTELLYCHFGLPEGDNILYCSYRLLVLHLLKDSSALVFLREYCLGI